jgi:hypothetical protein
LLYTGVSGLILLWTVESPINLIKPASIIGGVFTCGLWGFFMIWTDQHFLPPPLRMKKTLHILTVVSGTVLTGLGITGVVNYIMGLLGS